MSQLEEQVLRAVQGRNPLIYLHTSEEDRVADCIEKLASQCFPGGALTTWSCVHGFEPAVDGADARDPVIALRHMLAHPRNGFYLMKDIADFLDDPRVVRGLREAYFSFCRDYRSAIVLVSPVPVQCESLQKEICYIKLDTPSSDELSAHMRTIEEQFPDATLPAEIRPQVILALRGLTLKEVGHVLYRVLGRNTPKDKVLGEVFSEKGMLAHRAGFLEFVPLRFDTSVVGGLENIKDWAAKRKDLFNQETVDAGMPIPKGVLIMGISGCGKSLLAKSIAGLWNVPLFRLNMSLVFSGLYGSPESAFQKALSTIESMAPAVLWIDEMESSLSTAKEAATPQSMIFSEFLTWMQEKPPLVFVAATANRIEMLPAEIVRKGRFDQVFFCDLPSQDERRQILKIHLERNSIDPAEINVEYLVYSTEAWSGAEIEQAIISARVDAYQAKQKVTTKDILRQTRDMVPLSKTMAEQVKAIRDWAQRRATSASARKSEKPDHLR